MLVIVDYGMGNLRSVEKAFARLGHAATISADPAVVARATRVVLPGVGHFGRGMENLRARGLVPALDDRVAAGVPVLGICLGMQLMTAGSEEGEGAGLGWFDARTVRLQVAPLRVPHFGWNTIHGADLGVAEGAAFYFAHAYHVTDCADVVATTRYGAVEFPSMIRRGNVMAAQFHPEKSHQRGLDLLTRWLA